jgi:DNA-directed RNA polymerase subunit RPC12/RpoP
MSARIEEALTREARAMKPRIKDAEEASLRFETYYPEAEPRTYKCPACWMLQDRQSLLDPIPAGKDDALRCDECGAEFLV